MGYTDVTIPQSCIDCQSSPRMVVCHHVSSHCPENLFFFFFYHPFPLSSIWMGMHGSSMECSRIHSRVGLEFHHLLQIPSGSSPISVSCAGKLNKKINALCLFSLKVEPTESILKVWYFIPRDVCPQRCLVWLTRDNTFWTTASISHPTWIFL